jgi:hypothetical protein
MKDAARSEEKHKKAIERPKQLPLWLRRLDLVKAEMKSVRFPRTVQEGFRQCAELSALARRWLRQSIKAEHQGASEEKVNLELRRLMARWSAADARWVAKWKKERDRYFRR